ncbi:MAG TPA: arabinofuranosidase catalytic domain-containing protein, partial [Acetobacteraceae bacterium]|nr:arabinofuranosidase catalytic domain-containing protein [Acetobacteraceae bacterium]
MVLRSENLASGKPVGCCKTRIRRCSTGWRLMSSQNQEIRAAGPPGQDKRTTMKTKMKRALDLALSLAFAAAALAIPNHAQAAPPRPQGPCDIYAKAGDPCVGAHSTTRAMYAAYKGPLYQVLRRSDGKKLDIGVVEPNGSDPGGYANAAAQDAFCANTYCWITTIYDQSGKHNDLTQAPRGAFSGPATGGFNNVPLADMAPISIMGHKVYGVFIEPGMGLREDDPKGVAVDDQAEGQYWVISGKHFNGGCCFDYGNAEIDSHDDDAGTMETAYFGDATPWYHGNPPGPWVMTDQENNLVGCVNPGSRSKLCPTLPNMTSRFVTAMAKGEPHHWTTLGGDSQRGPLQVMFDGPRVDAAYDPMRKQGAILLGNGGDNSNGSQGTFYEGAVTAANTFPTDATDQLIQANVVAAKYAVPIVGVAPSSAVDTPPGLQTFTPGSSQDTTVTFTNSTGNPVTGVKISLNAPKGWTATASGNTTPSESIAPGASVSATFKVTSGQSPFNGDLVADVSWTGASAKRSETMAEKVRNAPPVKINEFSAHTTQPFIEIYNDSSAPADLSNWTLAEHPTQQAIVSTVKIPAGTKVAPHGFYLLGLSNSGLSAATRAGEKTLYVRSTTGMSNGDTVTIGAGATAETHKIASVGTPASAATTLWEPLPEGPILTIPAGTTSIPVTSTAGFEVGQKVALGYGQTYPAVSSGTERFEIATVTAVGKPGTQALLGAEAPAGSTNIKVTSVANISPGDKIRLDVDAVGHGIEWVTVKSVGTQAVRMGLLTETAAGATSVQVRAGFGPNPSRLAAGDQVIIGTPATWQTVTVSAVDGSGPGGTTVTFSPALKVAHVAGENVMLPGTGLELTAPLKFNHSANLPFSDRGTGITFQPATAFAHSSNEPIQALGTGITLDSALTKEHPIEGVVHDAAVTTAGYQGTPQPNQWFGGPALSPAAGNIVLRDATGQVVDSLNYGLVVDPWAAEGFQGNTPTETSGCRVPAVGGAGGGGRAAAPVSEPSRSAGRFPDGADTDSNCTDFHVQSAATLAAAASAGASNIKVASVEGFHAGQAILIGAAGDMEQATIASVGTPGASTTDAAVAAGATSIPV